MRLNPIRGISTITGGTRSTVAFTATTPQVFKSVKLLKLPLKQEGKTVNEHKPEPPPVFQNSSGNMGFEPQIHPLLWAFGMTVLLVLAVILVAI